MCVNECVRRDDCSGCLLAQHWKPQDGGDLKLGLHFSTFLRKRTPASQNVHSLFRLPSCYLCFDFSFASAKLATKRKAEEIQIKDLKVLYWLIRTSSNEVRTFIPFGFSFKGLMCGMVCSWYKNLRLVEFD